MRFEDVMFENKLEVGTVAYLDFKVGKYLGVDEEGYHSVSYIDGDVVKIKETKCIPTVPVLPLNLYLLNKKTKQYAVIVDYTNFNNKMFYKVAEPSNVFKDYEYETIYDLKEKYELIKDNPFVEPDVFFEELEDLDHEISNLRDIINSYERDILRLEEKRNNVTKHCYHVWEKEEAEEISNNNFEQRCVCNYCEEVKIKKFIRW